MVNRIGTTPKNGILQKAFYQTTDKPSSETLAV